MLLNEHRNIVKSENQITVLRRKLKHLENEYSDVLNHDGHFKSAL